jgi:hypothetical protein
MDIQIKLPQYGHVASAVGNEEYSTVQACPQIGQRLGSPSGVREATGMVSLIGTDKP